MAPLPEVDGLLREAERPGRAEPDLDNHQAPRRARVDRHEIELVATDMDVPGQDRPAGHGQPLRDEGLGVVAGSLGPRSAPNGRLAIHARIVAGAAYLAINARFHRSGGPNPAETRVRWERDNNGRLKSLAPTRVAMSATGCW